MGIHSAREKKSMKMYLGCTLVQFHLDGTDTCRKMMEKHFALSEQKPFDLVSFQELGKAVELAQQLMWVIADRFELCCQAMGDDRRVRHQG